MTKRVWKNLENKIGLMLLFVVVIASICVYLINYNQFYSLTMDELKQDAIDLYRYVESVLDKRIFSEINTIEDQESELYINTQKQLYEIKSIASALYLYTVKLNDNNEYIYVVDALDINDENFSHVGSLIEEEYLEDLIRCLNNEIVTSEGIMVTDYGYLYGTYFPFHDNEGNVIGAIGIDFDCERLYHSINSARQMTIIFTLVLGCAFAIAALFIVKRVVKHTEREFKKLLDEIQENTAQLEIAKEAAEQSSQAKGIFLSQMSHEIRTPMNAILGISEIRLRNGGLSEEAENGFEKIHESGSLLLNIINDILDFSQINSGNLELINGKYNVPDMINSVVQMNRLRYDSKPINFKLVVDENIPLYLTGDELRIKQILNNLLSNAYKYTDAGEICFSISAVVTVNSENVRLIVSISDTGQGMNETQIKSLYDAYSRFNLDINSGINGTGLGMNITKRLIDAMNGVINAESKVSKGTEVTVSLPQKRCGLQVCGSDIVEKLQTFNFNNKLISKISEITYEQISDGRVLIVDDMNINLLIASEMLRPYGLFIETADNGLEAVEKIKNNENYDIIFMDHMMPVMDGIKAAKIIRETGYTRPIVALTANAILGQEEMFLSNGFDAFIAKPIDSHILDQVVTKFIKNVKPLDKSEIINKTVDLIKLKEIFLIDAENTVRVLEGLSKEIKKLNEYDLNSYIITVHGIKSALTGIGEKELSDLAYKLEQAGKNKNFDLMASDTPVLINALSALVKDFRSRETEGIYDTSCDASCDISREDQVYLHEKFEEIKIACEKYDVKTAKKALADLKLKIWPRLITGINEEISVYLLNGEFKKVLIAIEKYKAEKN
ncbi:MAG: ATP-binding protein [Treponema sp.]|nr:ATP-binding protein [Treponema sp.]